jgi:hypothetical protein
MERKTKLLQIRVDDDFLFKVAYLKHINSYSSKAETVRKTIEKEYKKEIIENKAYKRIIMTEKELRELSGASIPL